MIKRIFGLAIAAATLGITLTSAAQAQVFFRIGFGLATQEQIEELKKEIELIQQMRDLANQMIKNYKNCKPQCLGVSSVVAHYCNCFRDYGKNCEDFAQCICIQLVDESKCKKRALKACKIAKQIIDAYEKSQGGGGDDD